jgi:DNA-binding beta-propeller fold protein YncE
MFRLHSRSGSRRRLGLGVATAAVLVAVAAPAHAAPFAYVANQSDGTVSQYDIGAGGLLAPLSPPTVAASQPLPGSTRPGPSGLAVSPDGKSVYVAIIGFDYDAYPVQSGVTQFDVGADGTLSPKSPAAIFTSCETVRVVVSPDGKSVYGSGSPDCAFLTQYDVGAGGTLSLKSPAYLQAFEGLGIAVSPDSRSVYVANGYADNVSQYDADAGGSLSSKSPPTVTADRFPTAIAVSPDGKSVYVPVNDYSGIGSVFQYDVGSGGKLSPKSPPRVAAGIGPDAVAVSPDGTSVYVVNGDFPRGNGTVSQYDVGQGGALSLKSPATVTAGLGARAVAVSPPGRPTSKKQCRHGGWRQFGFKSQGRCIRFVKYGPKR